MKIVQDDWLSYIMWQPIVLGYVTLGELKSSYTVSDFVDLLIYVKLKGTVESIVMEDVREENERNSRR